MIPKIIHYCWFGNKEKDKFTLECIDNWSKKCPNYKIIEWNENNCDLINAPKYVKDAYENKRWAFVSDYFRLQKLLEYGGIYLDTDVKLLKNFDNLLNFELFLSYESSISVCTAIIGSTKNNHILTKFIEIYNNLEIGLKTPNSQLLFNFLELHGKNIDKDFYLDSNSVIFKQSVFSPIDYYDNLDKTTNETIAIHYFSGTWKNKGDFLIDKIKIKTFKILGPRIYSKLKKVFKK